MANPKLFRAIDKAVSDYNMIETGDRILIAASGGKDSTAVAEYFAMRLKRRQPVFETAALHIATDIGSENFGIGTAQNRKKDELLVVFKPTPVGTDEICASAWV